MGAVFKTESALTVWSAPTRLLQRLADGQWQRGEHLVQATGLSSQEVVLAIEALTPCGVVVERTATAYRLGVAIDLLDQVILHSLLTESLGPRLERLETVLVTDSTNGDLLADGAPTPGCLRVRAAEFQRAGRGRRGRAWLQPLGSGVCVSIDWVFTRDARALGALGLAAGVAVVRALQRFSISDVTLKWPNDVLKSGAKLGGVLCELRALADGASHVVIGVGLNVTLPQVTRAAIVASGGLVPADLQDETRDTPSRTRLVAALVEELSAAVVEFEVRGLDSFLIEWGRLDALRNQAVRVQGPQGTYDGVAQGIAVDGGLQVESAGRTFSLHAGEVTVRAF